MYTYREYIENSVSKKPDKVCLLDEERTYTYKQVLLSTNGYINQLSKAGLNEDSTVYLRSTRSVATSLIFLALQAMGIMTAMIDPHDSLKDSEHISISDEEGSYCLYMNGVKTPLNYVESDNVSSPMSDDGDKGTVVILTSGSTGTPKEVLLSQKNIILNSLDTANLGKYRKDDIALEMLPLHHVFALSLFLTGIVLEYAVFFPNDIDIHHLVDCIEKYRITRMNGVPTLYKAIAAAGNNRDLSSLSAGLIGGAPSTQEEVFEIEGLLHMTLLPVYGMSECIGISCASYLDNDEIRTSGVGKCYSLNTIRLIDSEGHDVPKRAEGEIIVKSPFMCKGYLNAELPLFEGYLRTGDLGYFDENDVLHISGRVKDLIISNGNNISAVKIENAIKRIKGVVDCAVFGIKDEKKGEVPCAVIVGSRLTKDCIFKSIEGLNKNEYPTKMYLVDSLPMTSSHKIDKKIIKGAVESLELEDKLIA